MRTMLALLVICGLGQAVEPVLTVTLQPQVTVQTDRVLLIDIADLDGPEATVAAAARVTVRRLADLVPVRIDPAQVRAVLRRQLGIDAEVSGASTVARASRRFTADELNQMAVAHLEGRKGDRQITIGVRRDATSLVVPVDDQGVIRTEAEPLTDVWWGDIPYRIRILRGDDELARTLVVLTVQTWREVPVAARSMDRGHEISLHDITTGRVEVRPGTDVESSDLQSVLGWVTLRHVPAGTPIGMGFARPKPAISAGSAILLVYEGEGFRLAAHAQAMGEGVVGDTIRVRTEQGHTVSARIIAENQAQVLGSGIAR